MITITEITAANTLQLSPICHRPTPITCCSCLSSMSRKQSSHLKEKLNTMFMLHTVLSIHKCMNTINRAITLERWCNTVDRMLWEWNLTNRRLHSVMHDWNKIIQMCSIEVQNDYCVKYLSRKHLGGRVHPKWQHKKSWTSRQQPMSLDTVQATEHAHIHKAWESQCNEQVERSAFFNPICCTKIGSLSLQNQVRAKKVM